MTGRARLVVVLITAVALLGGAATFGVAQFVQYQQRASAPSAVDATASRDGAAARGARVVFRNTASGQGYGLVASVPLSDPTGRRTLTTVPCDRVSEAVAAGDGALMCLRTAQSVLTTFTAYLLDANGTEKRSWPLPGVPSRTRMSPDGKLVAYTSFVTGTSYGSFAFSTATRIATAAGKDYGNLEEWALTIDGARNTAVDRNFWGVTFAPDDRTFYATAATGGTTYLVRGDIRTRTLTAMRTGVECPSLSPDGTRIAFKKRVGTDAAGPVWNIAVLDLASGTEIVLPEKRNVDDQVEWLDDDTLLYGMPRADPGDQDVWRIRADGTGRPSVFIPHAWSPAVVRR